MSCFRPILVAQYPGHKVIFPSIKALENPKSGLRYFFIPCGHCSACLKQRAKNWMIRCIHEASCWKRNSFITLTYDDDHLPELGSLDYKHFQKFLKRLRKSFKGFERLPDDTFRIRYYMCGEYGAKTNRPHFHAILFNFDFEDKVLWKRSRSGSDLYRSPALEKLWPFGFSSIGEVTPKSIAYVSRYVISKVFGSLADDHYIDYDKETGEIHSCRVPEFNRMSLKPGIGQLWFERFHSDVYPHDFVVHEGKKFKPPRYYDKLLKILNPELAERVHDSRLLSISKKPFSDVLDIVFDVLCSYGIPLGSDQKSIITNFNNYLNSLLLNDTLQFERIKRMSYRSL